MPQDIVKLAQVSKIYQKSSLEVRALHRVDLTVKEGEYLAIMGSSGSGKSTMLNLLGCLDRPTEGQYYLGGDDVSTLNDDELSAIRSQRLGFVFQSFNLIEQLTVIENIQVPMFYQNIDPDESRQRAEDLARQVGLGDRFDHRPNELSGGQMQRVAIARSLANRPLLILADEPTGNLDSKTEAEILGMLDDLHQEGKTIIIVTHEESVCQRADRAIYLKDGEIERELVIA
ncbi:MAG: ABC transporter ATP-binding protein [Lentisphaeria bacterium]|nr:ABC transporter ATP-binding protein [Lentisphaeria bacterium]NQZ66656.1 ABC transporter ATP-binding protein [Lentisphaeria bacterium]